MCCSTRVRGAVPQPQSSSLALPCQILVSVDGCQSLAAFGSCIHWMRAPSRRPITPAGTVGKRVPSGHNRRRRLATRRCDTKRAGTTAVVPAMIEWQQCLLHLHFFDTLWAFPTTLPEETPFFYQTFCRTAWGSCPAGGPLRRVWAAALTGHFPPSAACKNLDLDAISYEKCTRYRTALFGRYYFRKTQTKQLLLNAEGYIFSFSSSGSFRRHQPAR